MKISAARLDAQSGRVDNAVLKDYAETTVGGAGGTNSGTAYTIDLSTGNTFTVFLNANCTFTFSNPPTAGKALPFTILLKQDGGSRTATWPSSVIWQSGTAPTLTTTAGAYDILTFMTLDAGTSYFGFAGSATTTATAASTAYALWAWGTGSSGQLGLGTATNRSVPVQVGTLATWATGGEGRGSSVATKSDGTLWSFGFNTYGELGQTDTIERSSPVQVGGFITWSQISGSFHVIATKTDSTLWSWGRNNHGQLGLGDVILRSSAVQIGTLATWSQIASGNLQSHAIKTDGTLWVWGRSYFGNLGLGDTVSRSSPVQLGTLTTWSQISAATTTYHVGAVKTDGTLWAWGKNSNGQLGQADIINRSSPVQVGTLSTWSQAFSVSGGAVAARKTDGTLWVWGINSSGQLGQADTVDRSSPVQVGTLATWSEVGGSEVSILARKSDNTLWGWGSGSNGYLGLGDTVSRSSPVQIGGGAAWAGVADSSSSSLFALQDPSLLANSQLFSWGVNGNGRLGLGDVVYRSSPVQVGTLATWSHAAVGAHTMSLKSDGTLWVWGKNDNGQLGIGVVTYRSSPVQVGAMGTWSQVVAGPHHSLALKVDGTLWAWGRNTFYQGGGQLGVEDIVSRSSPVQVGALTTWRAAAGGYQHSLALKTDGTLWSWGRNAGSEFGGQLGHGDVVNRSSPVQVGALAAWGAITGGQQNSLAVRTDGTLWGWGRNHYGQLSLGDVAARSSPVQVGTLATWSAVSSGMNQSFGIKADGTLWAWGHNSKGRLGLGDEGNTLTSRSSPVQVGTLATWAHINAGDQFSVGIQTNGTLWTWGENSKGYLGQGDAVYRSSPVQVGTLATWVGVAKGPKATHLVPLLWPPTTTTTAPGKPTAVIATVGSASGTAVVVWTAPMSSGGKPISLYTVTSSPGGITATTNGTFATVTGLTPTTSYTFTVTATNSVGTGSASEASNAVVAP